MLTDFSVSADITAGRLVRLLPGWETPVGEIQERPDMYSSTPIFRSGNRHGPIVRNGQHEKKGTKKAAAT